MIEDGRASILLLRHFSFQIRYQFACAQSEHMAAFRSGNSPSFSRSVRVSLHHRGGSKGFPDRLSSKPLVDMIAHNFGVSTIAKDSRATSSGSDADTQFIVSGHAPASLRLVTIAKASLFSGLHFETN
jgi:hypothetical protein